MGTIITLVSGKGGTGKTTSVAAIASCLATLGKNTLCIDFDIGQYNLDLSLCITDSTYTFADVLSGHIKLKKAIVKSTNIPKLYFLPAPNEYTGEFEESQIANLITAARRMFDYCILDVPSGVGPLFYKLTAQSDMSIIVTTGEIPAIRNAAQVAAILKDRQTNEVRLLITRIITKNLKFIKTSIDDIIDMVGVRLIGIVPEDKSVFRALHKNKPLIMYRPMFSIIDFMDIARRIEKDDIPLSLKNFPESKFSDFVIKNEDCHDNNMHETFDSAASLLLSSIPDDTEPIELTEPIEPIEPVEPVNAIEPVEPVDAIEPVEPVNAIEPIEPVNAIEPAELIESTDHIYHEQQSISALTARALEVSIQVQSMMDEISALGSLFDDKKDKF